jgi:hypothetical protein
LDRRRSSRAESWDELSSHEQHKTIHIFDLLCKKTPRRETLLNKELDDHMKKTQNALLPYPGPISMVEKADRRRGVRKSP